MYKQCSVLTNQVPIIVDGNFRCGNARKIVVVNCDDPLFQSSECVIVRRAVNITVRFQQKRGPVDLLFANVFQ